MGTKGGPEWGPSCQEGFELLGGVLGVQNGVMGGNRLKLGRIWDENGERRRKMG